MTRYIFILLAFHSFVLSSLATAQVITPLTPGSSYSCIKLPNGTAVLGKASDGGFDVSDTKEVKAQLRRLGNSAFARRAALTELKIDIKDGRALKPVRMEKVIDSYRKFVNGIEDPNEEVPTTKEEQIDLINELIKQLRAIETSSKRQLKAADKCLDNKPNEILPEGFLERDIVVANTGVAAVIYGKAKKYRAGITFCIQGDDKSPSSVVFQDDPCGFTGSFMSCKRKGFTGFTVAAFVIPDGFRSEEQKDEAVADVLSRSFSVYEAREQKVTKNYAFVSCDKVLN